MLDLQPIRARLKAATPGPWMRQELDDDHEGDGVMYLSTYICAYDDTGVQLAHARSEWDANLIANAPTDLAALVAEVERLRAENEIMRKQLSASCSAMWDVLDA